MISIPAHIRHLTDTEAQELGALCTSFTRSTLLAHCKLLEDALFAMQKATAIKRMVAELTLVRMCDASLDTTPEGLLSRIERLEDAVATGASLASAPVASAPVQKNAPTPTMQKPAAPKEADKPVAAPTPAVQKSAPTGRVLQRMRGYMNFVERVRRDNSMLGSFLPDGRGFIDGEGHIILQFENEFAISMLKNDTAVLAAALCAELKRPVTPNDILFEVPDRSSAAADTVLDELMQSVEP